MMRLLLLALALSQSVQPPLVHEAKLTWQQSNQVVLYRVHRGTKSGGPYTQIASGIQILTYTDTKVTAGHTYFYVVDARNPVTNLVSIYSNQVKAVIP